MVVRYARETSLGRLAPHDLRQALPQGRRGPRAVQLLLGHASIQTTERYLGTVQNLAVAVNDAMGLKMD